MIVHSLSNFFKKVDLVTDWIPFVSTFTNIVDLIGKGIIGLSNKPPKDLSNYYVEHLREKSVSRCLTLMVPVLGNITVGMYDLFHHYNQRMQLIEAAKNGDVEGIQKLIEEHADLNVRDYSSNTPLMLAAANGHLEVVDLLLTAQADVNLTSTAGNSALMFAAREGRLAVVERLMTQTDTTLRDYNGNTAILLAAKNRHGNVVKVLGPSCANSSNARGETALMWMAHFGQVDAMNVLMEAGADTRLQDSRGNAALIWAVLEKRAGAVRALIANDVDVNACNSRGETALSIAKNLTCTEIEQVLRDAGGLEISENVLRGTISFRLEDHVSHVGNNKLFITIPRVNMNAEMSQKQLHELAALLSHYHQVNGDFKQLSLGVHYENEPAIDSGGPSREFISQLLKNLVFEPTPFPFFEKTESGQYEIFDKNDVISPKDLQVCKDVGILFAAIFSGFPAHNPIKMGPFFTQKVYHQLLSIHEYFKIDPSLINYPSFNQTPQEKQEALALFVLERDVENESYRILNRLLQKTEWTDQELNQIGQFLLVDQLNGNESSMGPPLSDLLEILAGQPNGLELIQTEDPMTIPLYAALREALSDPEKKIKIKEDFTKSLIGTYKSQLIPMLAVAQGFESVNKERLTSLLRLQVTPLKAAKMVSTQIQGKPFTREAFVALMKRSTGASKAIREKIKWITEWCEPGIEGKRATDEQIKEMLRCITGNEVITDDLFFKFEAPVNEWSHFHTCFNSINLGTDLLKQKNKEQFIDMWVANVNAALNSGFGIV